MMIIHPKLSNETRSGGPVHDLKLKLAIVRPKKSTQPSSNEVIEKAIDNMTNLVILLHDSLEGPTSLIVQYVGYHGIVALAGTCKTLQTLLLGNNASIDWKSIALQRLQPMNDADHQLGDNDTTLWQAASYLIHTNLRQRKALSCLGLAREYRYESPRRGYGGVDVNRNENLCLFMGNNGTENYRQWHHLPFRESVPRSIQQLPLEQRTVLRKKHLGYNRHRGENVEQSYREPVHWTDPELDLLTAAGRYTMSRVGQCVTTVVNTIQAEMEGLPSLATSGSLPKGYDDPGLQVPGQEACYDLSSPLCPKTLGRLIKDYAGCKEATFGDHEGGRHFNRSVRSSWTMDLGKDVVVTDPAFQDMLQSGNGSQHEEDKLLSTIGEQLLPGLSLQGNEYKLVAKPHRMLIYGKDGKFRTHRDEQRGPGHFGTLVLVLPVSNSTEESGNGAGDNNGGRLFIRCQRSCNGDNDGNPMARFELQKHQPPKSGESPKWHAFTLGTSHEVRKVNSGYRVALVYQLWLENQQVPVPLARSPNQDLLSVLGRSIQHWVVVNAVEELVEFLMPLENHYGTEFDRDDYSSDDYSSDDGDLSIQSNLLGKDAWLVSGLSAALKNTDMRIDLEFNRVVLGVGGYPQGCLRKFERGDKAFPLEEQSKYIWLYHRDGSNLVDRNDGKGGNREIMVACVSIHHEKYRCRALRNRGIRSNLEDWIHPDDYWKHCSD